MQIPVADMRVDFDRERIFFAYFHNKLDRTGDLINRNYHVVRQGNQTDQTYRLLTVAAHIPNTFIGFQHIDSAGSTAQLIQLLHFQIQLVLAESLHCDDNINAVLIMRGSLKLQIVGRTAHIGIIHILHTGRINAGLHDFRHYVQGLLRIAEHSQQIKSVRRDRLQLKRRLSDNAQRALTAHDQLFQAVPGRFFL